MKHQSQNDLIDPEVSEPSVFDYKDDDVAELPDDAYVIGEDGQSVVEPDLGTSQAGEQSFERWGKPAAIVLGALCIVLTIWNVTRFAQGPALPPKPTQFQTKQALYLGVMKIDAFRRVHGATPDSLAAAGLPETSGYDYQRVSPTRYTLSFRGRGSKLEYDSNDSKDLLFGSPNDMLTMGDEE